MKRGIRMRLVALATAACLAATPALAAADGGEDAPINWEKLLDYSLCAAGIAVAASGGGLVIAFLTCGKVVVKYAN